MLLCTQDVLVAELRSLSEGICKLSLDEYQFCLRQRVVEDSRHGKMLTLGDNGVMPRDTLVLLKEGSTFTITNPKVCNNLYTYLCITYLRRESLESIICLSYYTI